MVNLEIYELNELEIYALRVSPRVTWWTKRYRIYRIYGLLIIYVSASDMINEMIFISILSNE